MRFVVGLACLLAASIALANGRGPLTNGIYFKPGDPHSLYVRSTFGLLISHDDGCTFNWYCEGNVGYGGNFDPKYGIATDGTIFATTFNGLRISRDGGCSFSTNASLPPETWIDALDISPNGEVWVGTASSGAPNDIYRSTDNGVTFQSRGMLSPTIWWKSVKIAKSNAMRVYIAGYQVAGTLPDGGQMQPTAHLFHSDDDGGTWIESPLTGVTYGATPVLTIAAIDPTNPDVAFVVSQGANPPMGDILYKTTDAGQTLTQVLAAGGVIGDVVIKDANTVYATTFVPNGMSVIGGPAYVSTNAGMSFSAMTGAPQLGCLGLREDGTLLGCGANWVPDYMAIAKSSDNAATWQKVWRFVELYGPGTCAAGNAEEDVCAEQQWGNLSAQFGVTGPSCGPLTGQVYGGIGSDPATPVNPKKKAGCCDAGSGPSGPVALAGLVMIWLRRNRRR
jgi:MYXO-CTERM domain-containing protein